MKDAHRFIHAADRADFDEFLNSLWTRVGEDLPPEDRVGPEGIEVKKHTSPSQEVVVVALPRPEHGAEAYFVAVVVEPSGSTRYFTLEHSWNLDDSPRTVLCEWVGDQHFNLGTGPDPTEEEFVQAVSGLSS
jgi:hypothetical protein